MGKYLDGNGLSHLIGKIKTALSGKSDTGHVHATGDVTSGTFDAARIPSLAISKITNLQTTLDGKADDSDLDALLPKQPASTDLPAASTSNTLYPLVLGNTFANNGKVSYLSKANFQTWLGWSDKADASDLSNYLPLTGGTLTGHVVSNAKYIYGDCSNLDRNGTAPSSATWGNSRLNFRDKDDEFLGQLSGIVASDGMYGLALGTTSCYVYLLTDGTNGRVAVSTPAGWRAALGLGDTSGAFPLTIAQGGTGLTSAPSMLTNLASTTATSPLTASPRPGVTGTLGKGNGGTGKTNTDTTYYGAKSLFSGTATTGTVTLSETAANYSMLLIQYRDNDSNYSSKLIIGPNGKRVVLDIVYGVSGVGNLKSRTVTISGTSITTVSGSTMDAAHNGGAGTTNHIYITQVWGWK